MRVEAYRGAPRGSLPRISGRRRRGSTIATRAADPPSRAGQAVVVFDVGRMPGSSPNCSRGRRRPDVYAFEPGSYARTIRAAVVWLHRLDNVTIVPAALAAEAAMPPAVNNAHQASRRARLRSGASRRRRARVGLGCAGNGGANEVYDAVAGFGLDRLDFLKADIEGWEVQMLQARATRCGGSVRGWCSN